MDQQESKDLILEDNKFLVIDDKKIPFQKDYIEICNLNDLYMAIEDGSILGSIKKTICFSYAFYYELLNDEYESLDEAKEVFDKAKIYMNNIDKYNQNLSWAFNILNQNFILDISDFQSFIEKFFKLAKGIENYFVSSYEKISLSINQVCEDKKIFYIGYSGYENYLFKNLDNWVYITQMGKDFIGPRNLFYQINKENRNITLTKDRDLSSLYRYEDICATLINPIKICRNGDILGNSGLYNSVVLSMAHNIPVICLSPKCVFDLGTNKGIFLELKEESKEELLDFSDGRIEGLSVYNPKYNMINNEFITCFITEDGILYPPYEEKIIKGLGE